MDQGDPKTYAIIGAAMEVHSALGCGFLEQVYHEALSVEFTARAVQFQSESVLPVSYKGLQLKTHYRADFICFDDVIVEIKAIKHITNIEEAQLLNYLKATGLGTGLILNFGNRSLQHRRFKN